MKGAHVEGLKVNFESLDGGFDRVQSMAAHGNPAALDVFRGIRGIVMRTAHRQPLCVNLLPLQLPLVPVLDDAVTARKLIEDDIMGTVSMATVIANLGEVRAAVADKTIYETVSRAEEERRCCSSLIQANDWSVVVCHQQENLLPTKVIHNT